MSRAAPTFWKRRGLLAWLLWPLSLLFRALVAMRRYCYRSGWCDSWKSPVPIVIVGNIVVGGAGKTPLVIALAERAKAHGLRAGIVSRGYRAPDGQPAVQLVNTTSRAATVGDEPLLLARRTGLPVAVAAERAAAVKTLLTAHHCQLVVCDDGLQHYALQRDLEIAVVNSDDPVGNGFCLPAGPLREPRSRLDSVDMIVYSGDQRRANGYRLEPDTELSHVVDNGRRISIASLRGRQIHAVAAIANPDRFFHMLRQSGLQITPHVFADHHPFRAEDFALFSEAPIVMTEKDAVKCMDLKLPDAWYYRVTAILDDAIAQRFDELLGSLRRTDSAASLQ